MTILVTNNIKIKLKGKKLYTGMKKNKILWNKLKKKP